MTQIEINDLIGKPFAAEPDKAYGPDSYSCYGLIWEVYRRFGIDIPKTNIAVTACKQASNQEILDHAAAHWSRIDAPEVPCGVLIQSVHPDYANHIAAYIGNGRMVHVTIARNIEVARLDSYRSKIIGFYRYVGAER